MKRIIVILAVFSLGQIGAKAAKPGPWFTSKAVPTSLNEAHRYFAKGDADNMFRNIRETVSNGADSALVSNMSELIESAYRQGIEVSSDFMRLPEEIRFLQINETRTDEQSGTYFEMEVKGDLKQVSPIRQLQLIRAPGIVILDKREKIGQWVEYPIIDGNKGHNFYFTSVRQREPYAKGLYDLTIEMKDGRKENLWFILSQEGPGTSPSIISPYPGESFRTKNPRFEWSDYRSEFYRPFELRHGNVYVVRVRAEQKRPAERWGFTWGVELLPPYRTSMLAGQRGNLDGRLGKRQEPFGYGEGELLDGDYLLEVGFEETRRFGALVLGRESVKTVPFTVALP